MDEKYTKYEVSIWKIVMENKSFEILDINMNSKKTIEIVQDYSSNAILIFEADCLEGK